MKRTCIFLFLCLLPLAAAAQQREKERGNDRAPGIGMSLAKTTAIADRAGGLHDKSNIRLYFENRGKLYPRRDQPTTPGGEYPANSQRYYVYRLNPYVGIPGNVIQGRWTSNEEFEAMGGYHNPNQSGTLSIAMSDRPETWPSTGWPVKDGQGNPVIKSDQDSYCVYSDTNNTKGRLGIVVRQTGYTYGVKAARDMILFKFEIVNTTGVPRDSLYFGMYSDFDIGNVSGGDPEYGDDKFGFDKSLSLVYAYDSDHYTSEWPGSPPGYMGIVFLVTPEVNGKHPGLTDMHYMLYDDDEDVDTVEFGIMASTPGLYTSGSGSKFFHLGPSPADLHFDDPAAQPATGVDLITMESSGPYTLPPYGTLTFAIGLVAGPDLEGLVTTTKLAKAIADGGFEKLTDAPPLPTLHADAGDRRVTLTWDNAAEGAWDKLQEKYDFEGYRIYRSLNQGATWDQIDRNANPSVGADPVPLMQCDRVDGIGKDAGLLHSYIDTTVVNGFEYWYSVTAYDMGDSSMASLETPIGNNASLRNIAVVTPRQPAIGRTPTRILNVAHAGAGTSDYPLSVSIVDNPALGGRSGSVSFAPLAAVDRGNMRSVLAASVANADSAVFASYYIRFTSATAFDVVNAATKAVILSNQPYTSGSPILFKGLRVVITDTVRSTETAFLPEAGDSVLVGPGVMSIAGADTLMKLCRFEYNKPIASDAGLIMLVVPTTYLRKVERVTGTNLSVAAAVTAQDSIVNDTYSIMVTAVDAVSKRIAVEVRTSANALVAKSDTLVSGGALAFRGVTAVLTFNASALPAIGTRYDVGTGIPKPLTYKDGYTYTIAAPAVNAQTVKDQLPSVRVVPNPYVVSSTFEKEYGALRREPIRQIQFIHLPAVCTITIFTLDGDRVKTIQHNNATGVEAWDLRSDGGREIATGVYLYLVKTDNAEKLDRFAVIK